VFVSVEPGENQDVVAATRQLPASRGPTSAAPARHFACIEVDDDRAMADTVLVTVHAILGVRTIETHLVAPV
jgi:hypothetical protein